MPIPSISDATAEARRCERLRSYCDAAALASVAVGCVVLCGWALHIALLKSVLPGFVEMKANTALGLLLSGAALWLLIPSDAGPLPRRLGYSFALLVTLLGAATLSEYVFRLNLRIDQLLFVEPNGAVATYTPGRMAPATAASFLSLGLALLSLNWSTRRGHRPAQALSLGTVMVAMIAVNGYLYHAKSLSKSLLYGQVALHTAFGLLLLSTAIFLARPQSGIVGDLTREGSGGIMARRFLPAVFFIPLLLGWIRLQGQNAGLYGTEFGLALYASFNIAVFAVLVCLSARKMNKEYDQRSHAEFAIQEMNAELEARVAERTKTLAEQTSVLLEQAALLDLTQDSIIVRDENDRITFWNQGAAHTYGWTAEQAIGRVTHDLLQTEFPLALNQIQAALLANGHWEGELVHTRSNKSRITVASRWALQRDTNGEPRGVLEINNDITRRKQADLVLEAHRQDQMRFKDEILSHVSHELRSPLAAIDSFSAIIADGLAGETSPEQKKYLEIILGNSRQLQSMVEDLLEVSRAKSGKLRVNLGPASLSKALEDAVNTLQGAAKAKKLEFLFSCAPNLPSAYADPTRLLQVLIILCDNAIKFTPEGGVVRVEAAVFDKNPLFLLVKVSDTGCGISPDSIERVFEQLYQVDGPGRAGRKGLGLGLHIARDLVIRQGGQIWVSSQPAHGSTFSFTLPIFPDAHSGLTTPPAAQLVKSSNHAASAG